MATVPLFRDTNMAAMTSRETTLLSPPVDSDLSNQEISAIQLINHYLLDLINPLTNPVVSST